jgi:signal transduction histidine kinase
MHHCGARPTAKRSESRSPTTAWAAQADLDRAFDRFFRGPGASRNEDSGGAGLGLAIVRRLIELHGGDVTVENVAPHGARFTVSLPRIQPPA